MLTTTVLLGGCNGETGVMAAEIGGDTHHGVALIKRSGCGQCHAIPSIANANGTSDRRSVKRGCQLEAGDMTAELRALLVGAQNDCEGIQRMIERNLRWGDRPARGLLVQRDRVAKGRRQSLLDAEAAVARGLNDRIDHENICLDPP